MADATAVVGLVGVAGTVGGTALGAAIAARAAAAVEKRREMREEATKRSELTAAARLVWLDLALTEANLLWAATRQTWDPVRVELPTESWERHRDKLALAITDPADWHSLATAILCVTRLRDVANAQYPQGGQIGRLVESIGEARQLVVEAAAVAQRVGGLPDNVVCPAWAVAGEAA